MNNNQEEPMVTTELPMDCCLTKQDGVQCSLKKRSD